MPMYISQISQKYQLFIVTSALIFNRTIINICKLTMTIHIVPNILILNILNINFVLNICFQCVSCNSYINFHISIKFCKSISWHSLHYIVTRHPWTIEVSMKSQDINIPNLSFVHFVSRTKISLIIVKNIITNQYILSCHKINHRHFPRASAEDESPN